MFGLGLACQAEDQSSHTKISTLAKALTEKNPSKSAKYRLYLHWKKKKQPMKIKMHVCLGLHYENNPIQIYIKFHLQKLKIFRYKNSDIFHISAQNIHLGTR